MIIAELIARFFTTKSTIILPELLNLFSPHTVLASTTGGDITFTGIINKFIQVDGSTEDKRLFDIINTEYINPEPLKEYIFNKQK